MTEPQIKDDMMQSLLEKEGFRTSADDFMSKYSIDRNELKKLIRLINADHDSCIRIFALPGGLASEYYIDFTKSQLITKFLHEGGYTKLEENERITRIRQDELYELTTRNLKLSIEAADEAKLNADKTERRARSAIRAAWVASSAAVGIIVWELIKTFVLKK